MSNLEAPYAVRLKDYQPPSYFAQTIELTIELDPDLTLITSKVAYTKRAGSESRLRLVAKELSLLSVHVNDQALDLKTLDWSTDHLQLEQLPDSFTLEVKASSRPKLNKALEGIYLSQGKFYSQCEPEGFRRITYYLDRPDVMAIFTTTLIADKSRYPVLLSNGNLIAHSALADGKHSATWHDPFPKPSYLFAVVAGSLSSVKDTFTTRSGRKVDLHIYVEPENIDKCSFAMEAIKRSMRWDEDVYQLEYDLDLFMIVAISDFNMGAMENKGLNIFNAKYVLASAETATDTDFEHILAVVGHEYFHNWTGNRVTLRDWFQLSLKEGLTVFRDQMFSADQGSHAVKRIQDVKTLREAQFPEDNGPMAHAVRPDSYIEINNFYTPTVYNKGAEIIRMLYGMLGPETYHRGMKKYFETFDGKAVTVEHFLGLMSQAAALNLDQFKRWYIQAGTPTVRIKASLDSGKKRLSLLLEQTQTKNKDALPLQIPVRLALIAQDGRALGSRFGKEEAHEHVLVLQEKSQEFVLENVAEPCIVSALRNFSAPVILASYLKRPELLTLLAHETDAFNKFEAAQTLFLELIEERCQHPASLSGLDPQFVHAMRQLLLQGNADPRLRAMSLLPPTLDFLVQRLSDHSLETIFEARTWLLQNLSFQLQSDLLALYSRFQNDAGGTSRDKEAIGRRELANTCLSLLLFTPTPAHIALVRQQSLQATNMTDAVAALSILASLRTDAREECLSAFYQRWKGDPLVIDKWFAIQASSHHPDVLQQVKELLKHSDFDLYNPNRVYSIFRQFPRSVPHGFHHLSGEGYALVASYALKLDQINPQVAAMLTSILSRFKSFEPKRQALMQAQLQKMSEQTSLSRDVYEVVTKSLQA